MCVSCVVVLPLGWEWVPVVSALCLVQLAVVVACCCSIASPSALPRLEPMLRWRQWQAAGAVLVSLPAVVVITNSRHLFTNHSGLFPHCYLFYVSMVHYCNFTQLNCWMKSCLATIAAVVYLLLVTSTLGELPVYSNFTESGLTPSNISYAQSLSFADPYDEYDSTPDYDQDYLASTVAQNNTLPKRNVLITSSFPLENMLNIFLLLLMVWFLNREFEISYRLSFHGNAVAAKDKARVQAMRDQADILLHNIIPRHVADQLKNTARYSEDVKDAGIIFASIVNFSGMYDESYMDGKECLRVLNELISDFDEILNEPRFSMVEKIKTIGSTYMAASGLNLCQRESQSTEHLYQLMEFALALQAAVDNFNTHLLEFSLVLRVGYNIGDVTAGVVGTTKLFYDIWGDAVNIASRMDSTGVAGRIQVPTSCLPALSSWYSFNPRGTVYVKGKDNMDVSLLEAPVQPPSDQV